MLVENKVLAEFAELVWEKKARPFSRTTIIRNAGTILS